MNFHTSFGKTGKHMLFHTWKNITVKFKFSEKKCWILLIDFSLNWTKKEMQYYFRVAT